MTGVHEGDLTSPTYTLDHAAPRAASPVECPPVDTQGCAHRRGLYFSTAPGPGRPWSVGLDIPERAETIRGLLFDPLAA